MDGQGLKRVLAEVVELHEENKDPTLHELHETVSLRIDILNEEQSNFLAALEDEKDCEIELDNILSMKVGWLIPFELASDEFVQLAEAIISGRLTTIGQVFADDKVRLVGVDVAGVAAEVAS